MAVTTPPTIDPAPTAPQRGDRTTFSSRLDAFITWLVTAVTQFGAVATNVFNNATDAATSASTASTAASNATTAATTATTKAGEATSARDAAVTAKTQAEAAAAQATGNAAFSDTNAVVKGGTDPTKLLRFEVDGFTTGTTRVLTAPNKNGTIACLDDIPPVTSPVLPYIHVRDEKSAGSYGGATTGSTTIRTLNTVKTNTITGASLSSNVLTLPAGTYRVFARAPAMMVNGHRLQLFNVTSGGYLLIGGNARAASGAEGSNQSILLGRFTLFATSGIRLDHATQTPQDGNSEAMGTRVNNGWQEVFAELEVWKES